MNIYSIDIPGGYSGTVEVSEGSIKMVFPTASGTLGIKRYNIHLLTPGRKNIEFDLLRFLRGEWCDYRDLQLDPESSIDPALREATKKQITEMKI